MKAMKRKKRSYVNFPTKLKDYSVLELIELGEKNNKIELAEPPKKNDFNESQGKQSSEE